MTAPSGSPQDLVAVGNYPDLLSAESVRACLEMEGIRAFVFDGEISNMQGWATNAFGGVKVMVAATDRDRAETILAAGLPGDPDDIVRDEDEIAPDGVHCPRCHSRGFRVREWWGLPADPLVRFLVKLFHRTRLGRCRDCRATFRS